MSSAMLHESIWTDSPKYEQAEAHYQRFLAGTMSHPAHGKKSAQASSFSPVQEIAKARKKIQQTLSMAPTSTSTTAGGDKRIDKLEEENQHLKQVTDKLRDALQKLTARVAQLEKGDKAQPSAQPLAPQKKEQKAEKDDDDDFDLFGSDDEEEEEEEDETKKARLEAYAAKKAKKPALIAKSNIILDIKPWGDDTDLNAMEKAVRSIECDGLVWKASKFIPVAYGIKKLQISCMIEDDKVGTDFLEEEITAFEDYVQSVDIAAFNKL